MDKQIATAYAGFEEGVLMRIKVPEKMRGMYLGAVNRYWEMELLLQRSSIFKLDAVEKKGDITYVDASLIYQVKKKGKMYGKNINSQELNQERFKLQPGDMRPISLDEFDKLVQQDESADGDEIDGDE